MTSNLDCFGDYDVWDHIANRESIIITATNGVMRWMAFTTSQNVHPRLLVELMVRLGEGQMDDVIEANRDGYGESDT